MPFAKRHEEIIKKITSPSQLRMWLNTFALGALVFAAGALYLFARRGVFDLYIANKVLAVDALVLIGLSFALSGLVYFWDFVDTKIIYRKFLGLAGFGLAGLHVIVSLFLLPEKLGFGEFWEHPASMSFGAVALLIFILMAAISNKYAFNQLGSRRWRALLRLGYWAFIFVLVHLSILKYGGWIKWFSSFDPILPPLSLLAIIFGVAVIILRLALWLSIRKKQKSLPDGDERATTESN